MAVVLWTEMLIPAVRGRRLQDTAQIRRNESSRRRRNGRSREAATAFCTVAIHQVIPSATALLMRCEKYVKKRNSYSRTEKTFPAWSDGHAARKLRPLPRRRRRSRCLRLMRAMQRFLRLPVAASSRVKNKTLTGFLSPDPLFNEADCMHRGRSVAIAKTT
jgi:hypothetical protein